MLRIVESPALREDVEAAFLRTALQDPADGGYLWVVRYGRGGEHLKVRVHAARTGWRRCTKIWRRPSNRCGIEAHPPSPPLSIPGGARHPPSMDAWLSGPRRSPRHDRRRTAPPGLAPLHRAERRAGARLGGAIPRPVLRRGPGVRRGSRPPARGADRVGSEGLGSGGGRSGAGSRGRVGSSRRRPSDLRAGARLLPLPRRAARRGGGRPRPRRRSGLPGSRLKGPPPPVAVSPR